MATQADFWGDLGTAQIRTPVSILREQAALLGKKTQNVLEARVVNGTNMFGSFAYRFYLVVPALDDYTYELFSIAHGIDLYPVTIDPLTTLNTEQEFEQWLRQKLSSPDTKRIIGNLLAQATG